MISSLTIRCIGKQLKELNDDPLPNVSLALCKDNNLLSMHGNLLIDEGIYKDVIIHFILELPVDYPFSAPKMYLPSNYPFNRKYHLHLYEQDGKIGVCNDFFSNYAHHFKKQRGSGWNPSYTLKNILQVFYIFMKEHDFSTPPSKEDIDIMKDNLLKYECSCGHLGSKIFPDFNKTIVSIKSEKDESISCGILKEKYSPANKNYYGYPVLVGESKVVLYNNIISWKAGYLSETIPFKYDVLGRKYNFWIPIYLNKFHFNESKVIVDEQLKRFRIEKMDLIFDLVYHSISELLTDEIVISDNIIQSIYYAIDYGMAILETDLDKKNKNDKWVDSFLDRVHLRNRRNTPSLGRACVRLCMSNLKINEPIIKIFLEEMIARKRKIRYTKGRVSTRRNVIETFYKIADNARRFVLVSNLFEIYMNLKSTKLSDKQIKIIKENINEIKEIHSFDSMFKYLNVKPFYNYIGLAEFIEDSSQLAIKQKY